MTKHKISRRDFLAALAAGTVAATACGLHRTFAEASHTFEYWVLNRELSFRRTREGIIYSCEGYPLTDGETSSPGFDNQTLDPAFDWFLGRNFGDPDNGFGLRHILYDTLYDPQLGTNGYGQPVCLSLSQPLQDLVYYQLPQKTPHSASAAVLPSCANPAKRRLGQKILFRKASTTCCFITAPQSAIPRVQTSCAMCPGLWRSSPLPHCWSMISPLHRMLPQRKKLHWRQKLWTAAATAMCCGAILPRKDCCARCPTAHFCRQTAAFCSTTKILPRRKLSVPLIPASRMVPCCAACCCPCCGSKALRMAACVFSSNALRRTIFGAQSMARPRPTALGRSGCRKKSRHSWPKCSGTEPEFGSACTRGRTAGGCGHRHLPYRKRRGDALPVSALQAALR